MSDAPRVLHLDDGPIWRGGQQQAWLLMTGLAARGIPLWLAARADSPLAQKSRAAGIPVHDFAFRGELDLFGPARLRALARRLGANILHAHTSHAHALALRAARSASNLHALSTRRVDFPIKGFFSRRKYADPRQHFIAISEAVRRELLAAGVPPQRIALVHSGVPPLGPAAEPRDQVRAALGIPADELALVNVGALTDHKGQRWLIEAMPVVLQSEPRARLHILGEGELRPDLDQRIARLGLAAAVRLHGHVPDARLKLAAFDLFVSSSHLEGLGTIILDAMQSALPVVAARAGGVPEIVRDGVTGRLVPARDPAALAQAIAAALRDPAQSAALAAAAQSSVLENFSAEAMCAGTLAVYRTLLQKSPNPEISHV